jgi:acetolactate synthase-1/2/3 large subunit
MNFQELVVAVENDLPVKVVILNNGHLGMVRQWQEMFYKKEYSASVLTQQNRHEFRNQKQERSGYLPDFVKMAEAQGAFGLRVEKKGELVSGLKKVMEYDGPAVLECVVKPDENVYPMVPPGASLTEMVHSLA